MIEAALIKLLTDDSATTAIVEGRIHPDSDPQKSPRPKITFTTVSTRRDLSNDGPTNTARTSLRLDCWSDRLMQAWQISRAVRMAVDGFRGSVTSVTGTVYQIDGMHVKNEWSNPPPILSGEDKGIQRVSIELVINHKS